MHEYFCAFNIFLHVYYFFYLYHYKLYSHRETCAAKCTKSPAAEFCPCSGASVLLIFLVLLSSCQHSSESGQGYRKERQPDTEGISGSRNLVQFLRRSGSGIGSRTCRITAVIVAAVIAAMIAVIIVAVITTVIAGGIGCNREVSTCDTIVPDDSKGMTACS